MIDSTKRNTCCCELACCAQATPPPPPQRQFHTPDMAGTRALPAPHTGSACTQPRQLTKGFSKSAVPSTSERLIEAPWMVNTAEGR
jgi:hypothetical protein